MHPLHPVILRYLRDEMEPGDELLLEQWLAADPANRELLRELEDPERVGAVLARMDEIGEDEAWERFHGWVEERKREMGMAGDGAVRGRGGAAVRRVVVRWMAAAAVVALGVGGWWWNTRSGRGAGSGVVAGAVALGRDVLPGGSKAVLTLAGGKRVVLDSAYQDTVMREGVVVVAGVKGRLNYSSSTASGGTEVVYNTLATPRGGEYQLVLADGTKVWLNAASSITYPTAFTGGERKVTVTGEVYLEVAKDAAKPLVVSAAGKEDVRVLGTSFDINAYPDEGVIRTTLLDGSVEVSKIILRPGEQAVTGDRGVQVLKGVDLDLVMAWKNGRFAFDGADVQTVMRQLARWYDVDVKYEGEIPKREFKGKIGKTLTLDQALKILTATRIHYTIVPGRQLIVRP
jgi:transmembrane sensor